MQTQRMGATLYELLITLLVLGVLMTVAAPQLKSTIEVLALLAARESVFGVFTRARSLALQHGGASIELSAQDDRVTVRLPSGMIEHELLLMDQDVDLLPDASADPVVLRYDAYGLGRMMSRTITLTSGDVRGGLTVSSFGRVRRW
jgi:Tfp pilus assembly protein FimT